MSSWTLTLTAPPNFFVQKSGTDMTGRPGYRTMEMIGGSSAPYLARTPCVPLFCTSFNRVGNKERVRLPATRGGRGIISIVRWNLRPVIFGVEKIIFMAHGLGSYRSLAPHYFRQMLCCLGFHVSPSFLHQTSWAETTVPPRKITRPKLTF